MLRPFGILGISLKLRFIRRLGIKSFFIEITLKKMDAITKWHPLNSLACLISYMS
jgi:hypothetical protein